MHARSSCSAAYPLSCCADAEVSEKQLIFSLWKIKLRIWAILRHDLLPYVWLCQIHNPYIFSVMTPAHRMICMNLFTYSLTLTPESKRTPDFVERTFYKETFQNIFVALQVTTIKLVGIWPTYQLPVVGKLKIRLLTNLKRKTKTHYNRIIKWNSDQLEVWYGLKYLTGIFAIYISIIVWAVF